MSARRRPLLLVPALLCAAALVAGALPERAASDDRAELPGAAVRVGTLHVGDGKVLRDVVIVVDGARIVSVQPVAEFDARRITHDLPRGTAAPGFVDAVTQIGLDGGAVEPARALTPGVRAADGFDGGARDVRELARTGTTTLGIVPAPGNLASGRAAVASLRRDGRARLTDRSGQATFAFQSPALRTSRVPSTLAGARLVLDAAFDGKRWTTAGDNPLPESDAALSELQRLRGEPVLTWVEDVETAEFVAELLRARKLTPTLIGLRGAHGEAARVAALGLPCVVTSLSFEDDGRLLALPGQLVAAGARVTLSTGAPSRAAGSLRAALALAVAHGLPTDAAVQTVTHNAALVIGASARVGRVAEGLEADLLVFDGAPWELRSRLLLVLADGEVVVDATGAAK